MLMLILKSKRSSCQCYKIELKWINDIRIVLVSMFQWLIVDNDCGIKYFIIGKLEILYQTTNTTLWSVVEDDDASLQPAA